MTPPSHKPKRTGGTRKRASHTAAKMARGVAYLARDPVHAKLLPQGAGDSVERLSLAAGILKPWMCRLFERAWYRRLMNGMVEKMAAGELMRFTLRKRFVDDEVRAAIADGARQVLVVGAGFDTLGLRMAEAFPHVTVVEVDAPATAARRRSAIAKMGATRANLHVVAADLAVARLSDVVGSIPDWQTDARSVAAAEGVLMYLDEGEVRALLGEIKNITGSETRVVFTYVSPDDKGRPYLGRLGALTRGALKLIGEPLRWAVRGEELRGFLEQSGFCLLGPGDRFDLRQRYLVPAGIDQEVGRLERFAVAEWG